MCDLLLFAIGEERYSLALHDNISGPNEPLFLILFLFNFVPFSLGFSSLLCLLSTPSVSQHTLSTPQQRGGREGQ